MQQSTASLRAAVTDFPTLCHRSISHYTQPYQIIVEFRRSTRWKSEFLVNSRYPCGSLPMYRCAFAAGGQAVCEQLTENLRFMLLQCAVRSGAGYRQQYPDRPGFGNGVIVQAHQSIRTHLAEYPEANNNLVLSMPLVSRATFLLVFLLSISLAAPVIAQEGGRDLAAFFSGHLRAEGKFQNYHDGSTRGVRVDLYGRPEGTAFRITTNLTYSDGEEQTKIWKFRKVAEGRYVGQRADLVGKATVIVVGKQIDIAYVAKVRITGGKVREILASRNTFRFTQPGRGTHLIRVSLMSVPVGEARLIVRKLSR